MRLGFSLSPGTVWVLFGALFVTVNASAAPDFKAGFAERDISPKIGMEQPGGYGKSIHTTFHDPCKVRAAVFDDGTKRVALVGVDALMLPRHLVQAARQGIIKACGIEPDAVLIGASHSHSSGPTGMIQPGEYDHGSELVKRLAYKESSCADPAYLETVRQQIVEAVAAADRERVPAECGFGRGHEGTVSFNRRLRMKNGQAWSHPGPGNPGVIGYAGPIDPEVGVIGAWAKDGRFLGCIVNFACHATTNPGGISANWIYYMEQAIRGALNTQAPVVFLQGACGDITQVDNLSRTRHPGAEQWARLVGGRVGAEAAKVLVGMHATGPIDLDAKSTILEMERRRPRAERVRAARDLIEQAKQPNSTDYTFAKEIVLLDALLEKEPVALVEVQAVKVGPAVFISNPAEFFVELGLRLKKESHFPFTFPVELANGCVGYVPTEEALGPNGGGYETRLTSYSNLEPAAGTKMVEAGLQLARGMKAGALPEPAKAPPFGQPWSYGNVPPELD
ncbi:MAG: hypothetical protein AB9869_10070 [Verrucomicrobiia bacterium]